MARLFACAVIIGFCPSLVFGQSAEIFCQYNDATGVVICVRVGETAPVFKYDFPHVDVGQFSKLASSNDGAAGFRVDREQCRKLAEGFRAAELEVKLNNSLEGLRATAEDIRAASAANLPLYKQIMLMYDGLFGRYKSGLQTYQTALKNCLRVTPYDVRPDRMVTIDHIEIGST